MSGCLASGFAKCRRRGESGGLRGRERGGVCGQEHREHRTLMASGGAWNMGTGLDRLKGNGVWNLSPPNPKPTDLQTGRRLAPGW